MTKGNDLEGEKLGPFFRAPIMASDAVSSVAYAIEEMLLVLVPILGLAAVDYLGLVTSPIILLFLVLAFSYSQIIACYPNGGGAYVVSTENIGKTASLVAASALMTGTGTVIVFVTRFSQGFWMLAIVVPVIVYIMYRIHKRYQFVGCQLKVNDFMHHYHKSVSKDTNLCIVLVGGINRSVLKALNYSNLITSNVVALHITTDEKQSELLRKRWVETGINVPLEVINSPYQELIERIYGSGSLSL